MTHYRDWPYARVFAHRARCPGLLGEFVPENTLAAIERCAQRAIPGIEIDVQLSSDGVPMLTHDHLVRIGAGLYDVSDLPAWRLAESGMSTLAAVMHADAVASMDVNVEIKYRPGSAHKMNALVDSVCCSIMKARGWGAFVSSFSNEVISYAHATYPHIDRALILADTTKWRDANQCGAQAIVLRDGHAPKHLVRDIRENGYWLMVYDVTTRERAQELFSLGVNAVITDFPESML